MIDKEVMVPSERPLVAAVIYNRLHRGMPLGIDATTDSSSTTTRAPSRSPAAVTVALQHPHPCGPAADADRQPGLAAIRAAARPAKVDYLYYVLKANGNGQHCFTASGAEFNQLVAAYNAGRAPASCRS
jgi:UPF0755 protein